MAQIIAYVKTTAGTVEVRSAEPRELDEATIAQIATQLSADPEDVSPTPPDEGDGPVVSTVDLPPAEAEVIPSETSTQENLPEPPPIAKASSEPAKEPAAPTAGTTPSRAAVLGVASAAQGIRDLYKDVLEQVPTAPKKKDPLAERKAENYAEYLRKPDKG